MLLSLGHVTVRSADFEQTERFYCDLLGLRSGPRPAIPVPGRWFYLGGEAVVHVLPRSPEAAADRPSDPQSGIDHFALNAGNRPAVERRLREAGQAFESRRLGDSEIWQIFLRDPDGGQVELCFPTGGPAHRDPKED